MAVLTLLVFLPALSNDFVNWDDERNFLMNSKYRGLGWTEIQWMWTSHLLGRYVPITWMTLGLDYTIWGMNPFGYHLTSILFHTVNAVLFYFLALALLRLALRDRPEEIQARIPIGALFAALVFALHPLRAESVAWVTERRDVVSGMFFLLAILAYLRGAPDVPGAPIRRKYYWACFGFFILALLSKEIAVTLPVILLILDVYPLRRLRSASIVRIVAEKIPFFVLSLADGVLALYIGKLEGLTASIIRVNWFSRLAISLYGLAFYLWKSVLPFGLAPFYALTYHKIDPGALPFQLSTVLVVLVTAGALVVRSKVSRGAGGVAGVLRDIDSSAGHLSQRTTNHGGSIQLSGVSWMGASRGRCSRGRAQTLGWHGCGLGRLRIDVFDYQAGPGLAGFGDTLEPGGRGSAVVHRI